MKRTIACFSSALFCFTACADDGHHVDVDAPKTVGDSAAGFDHSALLQNIGENIVYATYVSAEGKAGQLEAAVGAYCGALATADAATKKQAAQDAWRSAMTTWQHAEMMLFGPAAMDSLAPRDRVYAWNFTSSCKVDQYVVAYANDPAGFDTGSFWLVNGRGLFALEYLLFTPSSDHTCPDAVAPEGWDALADADRRAARCAYAELVAADVTAGTGVIVDAWSPEGQNYLGDLTSAGSEGSTYGSTQEALNGVTDAMFVIDTMVKDMKLAEPAGMKANSCMTVGEACLDELELPWAAHSREAVLANLEAFQMLYTGTSLDGADGLGFEDWLRAVGATELADRMTTNIEGAITAVEAIEVTMAEALTTDRQSVVDAHAAVKAVTDDFKSQFLTVLGLEPPEQGHSDND